MKSSEKLWGTGRARPTSGIVHCEFIAFKTRVFRDSRLRSFRMAASPSLNFFLWAAFSASAFSADLSPRRFSDSVAIGSPSGRPSTGTAPTTATVLALLALLWASVGQSLGRRPSGYPLAFG